MEIAATIKIARTTKIVCLVLLISNKPWQKGFILVKYIIMLTVLVYFVSLLSCLYLLEVPQEA